MHAVSAWIPAFEAAYAAVFGLRRLPAIDEMLTIDPREEEAGPSELCLEHRAFVGRQRDE